MKGRYGTWYTVTSLIHTIGREISVCYHYTRPYPETVLRPVLSPLCPVGLGQRTGQKLESLELYDYLTQFQDPWVILSNHGGLGSIWIRTGPTPCTGLSDERQVPSLSYGGPVSTLMGTGYGTTVYNTVQKGPENTVEPQFYCKLHNEGESKIFTTLQYGFRSSSSFNLEQKYE